MFWDGTSCVAWYYVNGVRAEHFRLHDPGTVCLSVSRDFSLITSELHFTVTKLFIVNGSDFILRKETLGVFSTGFAEFLFVKNTCA